MHGVSKKQHHSLIDNLAAIGLRPHLMCGETGKIE
jgi:hypothetical protein